MGDSFLVLLIKGIKTFKFDLIRDFKMLKIPRDTMIEQFRAVRQEKLSHENIPGKAVFHLDWLTNFQVKQSMQTQSSWFFEKNITLHSMVMWKQHETSYICTISNETTHKASGLILCHESLVAQGLNETVIVSDYRTSQYRNRYIVALIENFVNGNDTIISVKWIGLELGHGKGAADGVGAVVKKNWATL